MLKLFTVIERLGVVAIVVGWNGHHALLMFEHGKNEVEFANYPASAVNRFRVIG
jgi:hypothetical protein